jgi:Spy/CpxP family protein refolding chaperone
MRRKQLALLTASILTFAAIAVPRSFAATTGVPTTQGSGTHREAFERLRAALKQLDLDAQQKEKIKSILSDARTKLEALKSDTSATGQRREIIMNARKDIIAQLTSEQKKKLREILQSDKSESQT